MAKTQRRGADASQVRARIVDAAAAIIARDGFAAVTAPRLAAELGLRRPTIYYYYEDIDDIRIAAVRHGYRLVSAEARALLQHHGAADVLWSIFERTSAPLAELTHYALRHDGYRVLLAEITRDLRMTFVAAMRPIGGSLADSGPPGAAGMAFLIQAVATALAIEQRIGLDLGHSEVRSFFASAFGIASPTSVRWSTAERRHD